jgi:regulatory protein
VREKMRFSGWGERKIRASLRMKAIAPNIIDRALEQLVPENDTSRLEEVLRKKAAKTTARDLYDLKGKLVRFGMSRGFDLDDVLAITEQILRERE